MCRTQVNLPVEEYDYYNRKLDLVEIDDYNSDEYLYAPKGHVFTDDDIMGVAPPDSSEEYEY